MNKKKSNYTLGRGLNNRMYINSGVRKDDKPSTVLAKNILNKITLGISGKILGLDKASANAKKLGKDDYYYKTVWKQALLGNLGSDRYNMRRIEGQNRIHSLLGSKIVDPIKNVITLGKDTYDKKEKYGLEHDSI